MRIDIWTEWPEEEHTVFMEVKEYYFVCHGRFIEIISENRVDYVNSLNVSKIVVNK